MIKVKSFGYQTDNVQATVEYDLDGATYSFTVVAKRLLVAKMTSEEIKQFILDRVATERYSKVQSLVDTKLNALIDLDLES